MSHANARDGVTLAEIAEPDVDLRWIQPGTPIPADIDVEIQPGSKATRTELDLIRCEGWDIDIHAHVRRGGRVVGLCAGFQMLGRIVRDPLGLEGPPGETAGLGLLEFETEISGDKRLVEIDARDRLSGCRVTDYEMHMGRTTGAGLARPWLTLDDGTGLRPEGAMSAWQPIASMVTERLQAVRPRRVGRAVREWR